MLFFCRCYKYMTVMVIPFNNLIYNEILIVLMRNLNSIYMTSAIPRIAF